MPKNPLISLQDVAFSYPSAPDKAVLDGINIQVEEGEFVALVGANGSGKSTLLRLIAGLVHPVTGSVEIGGHDTRQPEHQSTLHTILGMVFQYPEDQVVGATVEEDIAFGLENLGWEPARMRQRVDAVIRRMNLEGQRSRPSHLLSAGQTQRLALAGVLAPQPRLLLFDEPTTMLDPQGRRELMAELERLHAEGITLVMVTHHMEEAAQAERVVVLHQGQLVEDAAPQAVFSNYPMLKRCGLSAPGYIQIAQVLQPFLPPLTFPPASLDTLLEQLASLPAPQGNPAPAFSGCPSTKADPVVSVEHLVHQYQAEDGQVNTTLQDVSMQVMPGCSHSLLGATGSGKSTLMLNMMGLEKPVEGTITIGGVEVTGAKTGMQQILRQAGMVFQNPEIQFFEQYAGDEAAYGARMQGLSQPEVVERVRWAMEIVGLDFEGYKDRLTFSLSGGERRKLALASTLVLQTPLLLLDEPTAGLDPASRKEIIRRLQLMQQDGRTLLLSTHDMNDVAALTESATILKDGKVLFSGPTRQAFLQPELLEEAGLEMPAAAQAARVMRNAGWQLPEGVMTLRELEACLAASLEESAHA